MTSGAFRQQMDSGSSSILLLYSPQRVYARGLTLIGVLLTLAGGKGQWVMIYLVMEAWNSRVFGQRLLSCETLLILAAGNWNLHSSLDHHSNMNDMQGQNSRVPLRSHSCLLCHDYTVKSEYKQCTERTGRVNRPLIRGVRLSCAGQKE